jgi:GMP synthase (glutamine-hydrolysing)
MTDKIAILDFGSQYTQLIARRLREMGIYSEIFPFHYSLENLKKFSPKGIILSGGPSSVEDVGAPYRKISELVEIAPILGLCYGLQLIAKDLGGKVIPSNKREYGMTYLKWEDQTVYNNETQMVWMSHGDTVEELPKGFKVLAKTNSGALAAVLGTVNQKPVLGLQFHPEVSHTQNGEHILGKFAFDMCGIKATWSPQNILSEISQKVKAKVPETDHVLCALSGGVDSTVVGVLLTRILGADRVDCVFVNNGLLRKNEYQEVLGIYKSLGLNVTGIDAEENFLSALKGVTDPEKKRKIIGNKFIEVFDTFIKTKAKVQWLAQGTLYPDVIESVSPNGTAVTIKTHHNVGGLPEKMKLKLVEPLRELFKDEVRAIGAELGIPKDILGRHPFPGPGLAVRILGEVTKEDLDVLRDCDAIFIEELKSSGIYNQIWQAFSVLLPIRSVGVQGDSRSYEKSLALRAVTSKDGMTADWFDFSHDFLKKVSGRITNEVRKVNRVVYDITSKPPGTIEWE